MLSSYVYETKGLLSLSIQSNDNENSTIELLSDSNHSDSEVENILGDYFNNLINNVFDRFKTVIGSDSKVIKTIIKQNLNRLSANEFWYSLVKICNNHQEKNPEIELLRRAIAQHQMNFSFCPIIQTLDELVITQQKKDYLEYQIKNEYQRLNKKCKKNPNDQVIQRKVYAYHYIIDQIKKSDPSITLSDILNEDNIFLKREIAKNEITGTLYTIESILNEKSSDAFEWGASQPTSKIILDNIRNALADLNPYTVLYAANTIINCSQMDDPTDYFCQKNKIILNISRTHLQKYNKYRYTHHDEFNRLYRDGMFIADHSDDHRNNYHLIINKLNEAYTKQERNFKKPFFPLFSKEKSKEAFEKTLNENLCQYYYPRMLREILKLKDFDPLNIDDAILYFALSNTKAGERIVRGTPLPLKENTIRLSKSIDMDENDEFYIMPGIGKNIIGIGTYGVVKNGIKKCKRENSHITIFDSSWVKKGIKGQTYDQVVEEVTAVRACAPSLKPSMVFSKNENNHRFFMKNAGEFNLEGIITGKKKLFLSKEDILDIFGDILKQAYTAQIINRYIMFDIKPGNIAIKLKNVERGHKTIQKKKATIIDHGSSKPIGHQGFVAMSPAYIPYGNEKEVDDETWMVYQIGMVIADAIIASKYPIIIANFRKKPDRCTVPCYLELFRKVAKEMLFESHWIDLVESMIKWTPSERIHITSAWISFSNYLYPVQNQFRVFY